MRKTACPRRTIEENECKYGDQLQASRDWHAQENEQSNKNEFKEILPTELQQLRAPSYNTGNHSGHDIQSPGTS